MKRLFFLIFLLIFVPFSTFAISLNELERNSTRYIKQIPIGNKNHYISYIDKKSIKIRSNSHLYEVLGYKYIEYNSYLVDTFHKEILSYKNEVVFDIEYAFYLINKTYASDYGIALRNTTGTNYAFNGSALKRQIRSFSFCTNPHVDSIQFDELLYVYRYCYHHDYIKKF